MEPYDKDVPTHLHPADKSHDTKLVEEVVAHCATIHLGNECYGKKASVVRLRNFAIKFGTVSQEEVSNQRLAYELLDARIIQVPQIHCFFTRAGTDYLVMDYIEGEIKELSQARSKVYLLARAVNHMHSFEREQPGPANGGQCSGTLWPDGECTMLRSREHLTLHVSSRLLETSDKFDISHTPFVFTHGDISLRNILFLDERIGLLDWEFGGYYPRSAEIAVFYQDYGNSRDDLLFHDLLAEAVLLQTPLTEVESNQVNAWLEFAFNNIRFSWATFGDTLLGKTKKKKKRKPNYNTTGLLEC